MSDTKLHLVFGGRVDNPQTLEFTDLENLDIVGMFPDYASAEEAWRGAAQRTVDDAEMKYVVVHLHRLLQPDLKLLQRTLVQHIPGEAACCVFPSEFLVSQCQCLLRCRDSSVALRPNGGKARPYGTPTYHPNRR